MPVPFVLDQVEHLERFRGLLHAPGRHVMPLLVLECRRLCRRFDGKTGQRASMFSSEVCRGNTS